MACNDHSKIDVWDRFIDACIEALTKFQDDSIDMSEAWNIVGKFDDIIDNEIVGFVFNTISEIGGYPECYEETLQFMIDRPSEPDFIEYMNREV